MTTTNTFKMEEAEFRRASNDMEGRCLSCEEEVQSAE